MNVLMWFKRDLRVADHPALAIASMSGPVLPVYVVEPDYWALPDTSARQWGATADALVDLRQDLASMGGDLIIKTGEVVEVLSRLCRQHQIHRIVSHIETGNLWTYARDRRVAAWAKGAGIGWEEVAQNGVVRRLQGRDGWARQRDAFMSQPLAQIRSIGFVQGVNGEPIAGAIARKPDADGCRHRQNGGRVQGMANLNSFLDQRALPYRSAMSSPLTGERACSRLSVPLATGALSLREVVQTTALRQASKPAGGWGPSLRSFQSRLAWHDHFIQKLEDQPSIELRALHASTENLRSRVPDATRLAAWQKGETGLPFVDACMRYLTATGWLNFRMRAMVMSVASYHLWLDWRATGTILARLFTDYEPGIHWPQVQMQSGTTGINTPRIYNPVKQGQDQDPTGIFTRRWCPELAMVPDTHLQTPWTWSEAGKILGRRYPEPIVDVATAGRLARDQVWALRKDRDFAGEAARIVVRHASRKDGSGRFVNDRSPTRRPRATPATTQMTLDL
jgi:deoxyribodipyrimidine photo-lyase